MTTDHLTTIKAHILAHFGDHPPKKMAVGVSGGSDSLALLVALNEWRRSGGPQLVAYTVDHTLRKDSAAEAEYVSKICQSLRINHVVMVWGGWDGQGNLSAAARHMRYDAMRKKALASEITDLVVAHTMDDQAETFVMRLLRGAGIDGLSAMPATRSMGRVRLHRPLLGVRREVLRDFLRERDITWCEDPSNHDEDYDRVKARQVLGGLEPMGLSAEHLAMAAARIGEGRAALSVWTTENMHLLVTPKHGDLLITRSELFSLPHDIYRRLLMRAVQWISGETYSPRGTTIQHVIDAIQEGKTATAQGCLLTVKEDEIRLTREYAAVEKISADPDKPWDRRWRITGPYLEEAIIGALGPDGWGQIKRKAVKKVPYASLIASPALWVGDQIIAAPLAGIGEEWRAELIRGTEYLFTNKDTH